MAAQKGNTYWKLAKGFAVGAEKKYSPNELWTKAVEYFMWVEKNPLKEEKVFGSGARMTVNKMRAMTITGFCLFAQIGRNTFGEYCNDEAYTNITARIRDVIYTQKFEGAAADLLNANIISRELELKERTDHTTDGNPIAFKGFEFLPHTPEVDE
jgi:hypothetical protein